MTIERLAFDCLDVRELRRKGYLGYKWITIRPSMRFPHIAEMVLVRYLVRLRFFDRLSLQLIRVSWTRVHLGGERPWFHCPFCERRVAKLYRGLGGYLCRACVGNPIYASQAKSSQSRNHFEACKLRLHLGGYASLSKPFPECPRGMHERTYERLRLRGMTLETGLSERMKRKAPDYPNLAAYDPI